MKRVLLVIAFIPNIVLGQIQSDKVILSIMEGLDIAENQLLFNKLLHYSEHPINLNKCQEHELNELGLLSTEQVKAIIDHRNKTGDFYSVYELQAIAGLVGEDIQRILPFIEVKYSKKFKERTQALLSSGYNYSLASYKSLLEVPRGIQTGVYLGSPGKSQIRSKLNSPGNMSLGFVAQKDIGETWLNNKKLPDFLTGHLYLEDIGPLKKIVIGNYKLQYGQGLIAGSGFMTGKNANVISSTHQTTLGILPYSSMTENDYMQGLSMEIAITDNVSASSFFSQRKLDASVEELNGESVIRTVRKSGLHRTVSEINGMNTLNEVSFGGAINANLKRLNLGVLYLTNTFSDSIAPLERNYNQHLFRGSRLDNFSIYSSYQINNLNLFTEVSRSIQGGTGWIAGMIAALGKEVDMSILARSYDPNFYSFYGRPFSEQSSARNETGIYWGLELRPTSSVKISAYYDYYQLPWFSYQSTAPGQGSESLVRINFAFNKKNSAFLQFKSEAKDVDLNDRPNPVAGQRKVLQGLINFDYSTSERLSFRTRVQYSRSKIISASMGLLMFQDINFKTKAIDITARVLLFDVDDNQSRLHTYEKDLLYNFLTPSFIGKGLRYFTLLKISPFNGFTIRGKWSQTIYHNQTSIGSGYDLIPGNKKSEFGIQLALSY